MPWADGTEDEDDVFVMGCESRGMALIEDSVCGGRRMGDLERGKAAAESVLVLAEGDGGVGRFRAWLLAWLFGPSTVSSAMEYTGILDRRAFARIQPLSRRKNCQRRFPMAATVVCTTLTEAVGSGECLAWPTTSPPWRKHMDHTSLRASEGIRRTKGRS